jgi:tRNA G18 (ribose-2'-O)-methylase SpoU
MIGSSPLSSTQNFLLGAVTALMTTYAYFKLRKATFDFFDGSIQPPEKTRVSRKIVDAPDLEWRTLRKAEAVIRARTDKIVVVIERCTNTHNYSAILRSCEALGIQTILIIDPPAPDSIDDDGKVVSVVAGSPEPTNNNNNNRNTTMPTVILSKSEQLEFTQHRLFAQNATEWLDIIEFPSASACLDYCRANQLHVWVTDLSQEAVPLTHQDLRDEIPQWPDKVALVFGTESVGCSQEMLDRADLRIYLPLSGFADSLNLSVATALVIQQIFHLHPSYVGSMDEDVRRELRRKWFPKLARQRLMSKSDKKQRSAILKNMEKIQYLQLKQQNGVVLTPEQIVKINTWDHLEQELEVLERKHRFDQSQDIVEEFILHPPEPLSDLRRANDHRVTYVGKNTKLKYASAWGNLAAVANAVTHPYTTARGFRQRLQKPTSEPVIRSDSK